MLGKVSVQPSVGHWKVLPEQRNRAEIQQHPPGAGGSPSRGCPAPARLFPLRPVLCSFSWRRWHHHQQSCLSFKPPPSRTKKAPWSHVGVSWPYPRGTAWVCSGPSGGPSAPACWRRRVCSRSSSTGSASLEGQRSVGTTLALGTAATSPGAGQRLTWDWSALQRPQLLGWGPSTPCHWATRQSCFSGTCWGEAVRQPPASVLPQPPPAITLPQTPTDRGAGHWGALVGSGLEGARQAEASQGG